MSIEILNGHFLNESGAWKAFKRIEIHNDLIAHIDPSSAKTCQHSIDATGLYLSPSLTDLNVALCEPGYAAKGSIYTETHAAAAAGVTTVCCTPETDPVNDSEAVCSFIERAIQQAGTIEVLPLGALTQGLEGERLAEYAELKKAGCVALSSGMTPFKNLSTAKRCFDYAKTFNMSVFIHPMEPSLYEGSAHSGRISTKTGLKGISHLAESIATAQLIMLARESGVHLHLAQLSCKESVALVKRAKDEGANITADVAVANLLYTHEKIVSYNSLYHCLPPLRGETDRLALIEGLRNGVIDAITSAHRPHEAAAKKAPFAQTAPGMSTIEHLIPAARQLQAQGELALNDFLKAMTQGPAKVLNRKATSIVEGNAANLCLFNPDQTYKVSAHTMLSEGKNSPLLGQEIKGKVVSTIYKGRLVYQTRD
jgi:dihydroorotase